MSGQSELLTRFLTAIILAPIVVALVLLGDSWWLMGLAAVLWILGGWEWAAMLKANPDGATLPAIQRAAYLVPLIVAGAGLWWSQAFGPILIVAAIWWIAAFLWVRVYPKGLPAAASRRGLKALIGFLVLVPSWVAISGLHTGLALGESLAGRGPELTFYLLLLIWAADVGAYFAGKRFGKRKLAPNVSPGKSWEGVYGALAADLLLGLAGAWYFGFEGQAFLLFAALSLLMVPVSVVGDLTESMFKRHAKIKDSGSLFPGHGGVLDRIDGLTSAIPVFTLGLWLLF